MGLHLYSNNPSVMSKSSLEKLEFFPDSFSFKNKSIIERCSEGSQERMVTSPVCGLGLEGTPETLFAGDLSNLEKDLSPVLLLPLGK